LLSLPSRLEAAVCRLQFSSFSMPGNPAGG
jgi:hypothetical protein